jgi:alkaline phosphatase
MTSAALTALARNPKGFWLMVEAGDVDWANHDNNLDNSIGAVNSGDAAVKTITAWVEQHSNWKESVVIVTADHGHYLMLDRPELLVNPAKPAKKP